LRELEIEGIETRKEVEASGVTIKVRKTSLDDARFVLARVAFSREATFRAPRAETGRRRWSRATKVAAGLVGCVIVLFSALALAPAEMIRAFAVRDDGVTSWPHGEGASA
jgi:hypothetical protein